MIAVNRAEIDYPVHLILNFGYTVHHIISFSTRILNIPKIIQNYFMLKSSVFRFRYSCNFFIM